MPVRMIHELPSVAQFYFDALGPRQPLVIRLGELDAKLDWNTARWDADYLAHKAGSQNVRVLQRVDPNGNYQPENTRYEPMMFRRFIDQCLRVSGGTDELYLNLQHDRILEPPLLQLLGDFRIPEFYRELPLRSINVWIGNSRNRITTPMHHDFNENLYVIVRGRKRFTLFPPDCVRNLYPRGEVTGIDEIGMVSYKDLRQTFMPHLSRVDVDAPDLERFPAYREVMDRRTELELQAGDLFYLPSCWLHQVHSLTGEHIALSFFAHPPEPVHIDTIMRHREAARPAS